MQGYCLNFWFRGKLLQFWYFSKISHIIRNPLSACLLLLYNRSLCLIFSLWSWMLQESLLTAFWFCRCLFTFDFVILSFPRKWIPLSLWIFLASCICDIYNTKSFSAEGHLKVIWHHCLYTVKTEPQGFFLWCHVLYVFKIHISVSVRL